MTEVPGSNVKLVGSACIHCGEEHPVTYAHCPKTGKDITAGEALIGRTIGGRYKVVGLLGEGGMGAVYVAEHTLLGRKVAIKRLHPELASEDRSVLRFQREARAAGATGHDHIVDILDLGFAEDGAPFLVMEYLNGQSLAQVLSREDRLAPARACHILGQALDALAAVHREGIVHRDLKPDNLFLTRRAGRPDYVKVLDFGVSKIRRDENETFEMTLTRTGVMVGTPYYMSPEQARGMRTHDHRIDLYAVGVILYQCLAGRLPFHADNYHALLQAILRGQPPRIDEVVPGLDRGLADVVHRAIATDPAQRYPDCLTMLEAMVPHGAVPPSERAASALRSTTPYGPSDGPPAIPTTWPEARRSDPTGPYAPAGPKSPSPDQSAGRAPRPHRLAERPRAFSAQSSDWDGRRTPALEVLEPTSPARPRRTHDGAGSPGTALEPVPVRGGAAEPSQVKGTLVLAAMEHLRNVHGEDAHGTVLGALPAPVRASVEGMMLPLAWVPLDHYDQVLRVAERDVGRGDGALATELGAAAADADLPQTHRLFLLGATPATAVQRIPQLFRSYHSGGEARVEGTTGGSWRVTMDVEPDTLLHTMAMTGFHRRLLELTGGREPTAWLVSSRARGDERTIIALRWR